MNLRPKYTLLQRGSIDMWHYSFFYPAHVRHRGTTGHTDHKKAIDYTERIITQVMRRITNDGLLPDQLPAWRLFELYNSRPSQNGRPKSAATVQNYVYYGERFFAYFQDRNLKLSDLAPTHIEKWRDWLLEQQTRSKGKDGLLSAKCVKEHIEYLSAVYKAFRMENPCSGVIRPQKTEIQRQEEFKVYTEAEMGKLFRTSALLRDREWKQEPEGNWHLFFLWLRVFTWLGIRRGEAQTLRLKDIDFKQRVIWVASYKTQKRRMAPR